MSKYTTEVRYICENSAGLTESVGYNSIEDKVVDGSVVPGVLSLSAPNVFDFSFPIFDENYRLVLEKKILRHYYTREICEETVGLWKLRLCDRLNIIMPYYNQMYQSELLKFNPFYDVDLTRAHSGKKDNEERSEVTSSESVSSITNSDKTQHYDGESENVNSVNGISKTESNEDNNSINNSTARSEGSTNSETKSNDQTATSNVQERWDKYADTPQGAVTGLANDTYLTNARHITDNANNSGVAIGVVELEQGTINSENNIENANVHNERNEQTTTSSQDAGKNKTESDVTGSESANSVRTGVGKNEGKNIITGTDSYVEHVFGKQGTVSYSKMLTEFRQTFINIDNMIIDELSDLFFGLW